LGCNADSQARVASCLEKAHTFPVQPLRYRIRTGSPGTDEAPELPKLETGQSLRESAQLLSLRHPTVFSVQNDDLAVDAIRRFYFLDGSAYLPGPVGWVIMRLDEGVWIREIVVCPPNVESAVVMASLLRRTLDELRRGFPDSLVMEVSHGHVDPSIDFQARHFTSEYFDQLRRLRTKPVPWPEQEYLDTEAALANGTTQREWQKLRLYRADEFAATLRRERTEDEIAGAKERIRKLQGLAYEAAEESNTRYHQSRKKDFVAFKKAHEDQDKTWMQRLRTECPGFSDWVYHAAIHDWGSWAAR
jgi:hypothetical protein